MRAGSKDQGPSLEESWTRRVELVGEVESVEGSTFHVKDGNKIEGVQVVVSATGYLYS